MFRFGLRSAAAALALGASLAGGVTIAQAAPVSDAASQASAEGRCEVRDARVEWGFKESFRSYLSGAIALGSWSTSGDVGYETPAFVFSGGEGSLSPDRTSGEVDFVGELTFTGHGGVLNTSLGNPRVVFVGEHEAALYLDVRGETMLGAFVDEPSVEFVRITWRAGQESVDAAEGLVDIEGAQVVLTSPGAGAFGTYLSGEVFDPMDISLQVEPGCLEGSQRSWWWIPGGAIVAATVAAGVVAAIRQANRSPGPERQ